MEFTGKLRDGYFLWALVKGYLECEPITQRGPEIEELYGQWIQSNRSLSLSQAIFLKV